MAELLLILAALLIGLIVSALLIGGVFVGIHLIGERNAKRHEEEAEHLIERPDAGAGIDRARENHPSPDAHSELEALEVDGPVFVRKPEHVVRSGR